MGVKQLRNKTWQIDLRSTYVKVVPDEATARMLEASGKHQLALGRPLPEVVAELRGESRTTPTLAAYFAHWLPLQGVTHESRARYQAAHDRLPNSVKRMVLDDVDLSVLKSVIRTLDGKYAPNTVHQTVTMLKAVLNDACDEGVVERRPPSRIKGMPAKRAQRENVVLTRAQHEAVWQSATDPRYRVIFRIAPLVGLRRGEVAGLERRDCDLKRGILHVRRQVTNDRTVKLPKYGDRKRKQRHVDLCDEAREALEEWLSLHPSDVVFYGTRGHRLGFGELAIHTNAAGKAAGIDDLNFHDFRHTYGSWLLDSGASVAYVAARLGDNAATLLGVYAHEIEVADSLALPRFEAWLRGTDGKHDSE